MAETVFFPDNKLNVELCDHYNGHVAVITQNTDRLKDGKFELAELNCFKHNIQGTSFLNPFAVADNENADYNGLLQKVDATGRLSFGIYYRTDSWVNPSTDTQERIPSYFNSTWQQDAIDAGFNVTLGASKTVRFPNHGQQLYDISNGDYGYDFANDTVGTSQLSEVNNHSELQINYFKAILGRKLSCISYENGRSEGSKCLIPYFLGGRTSSRYVNGDSTSLYGFSPSTNQQLGITPFYNLSRSFNLARMSNTRAWDTVNDSSFSSQSESITYMRGEIFKVIRDNGFFTDFMHWHSLYDFNDVAFFDTFFNAINTEIANADVWRAGYTEALEYMYIRDAIDLLGSFSDNGNIYVAYRVNDNFLNTNTEGIDNASDIDLFQTPISIKIDVTGTSLAGQNIKCSQAKSIRSLGNNVWIINAPFTKGDNGYSIFKVESGTQDYYNANKPIITNNSGVISTDMPCKFVVWRKATSEGIETTEELDRVNELSNSYNLTIEANYNYYVGAISASNQSDLISI